MDERLIRLEEASYFQEERLKELDERIVTQQAQIDLLERRLESVTRTLIQLREVLFGNMANHKEKPPHYQDNLW